MVNRLYSPDQIGIKPVSSESTVKSTSKVTTSGLDFQQILQEEVGKTAGLKFSAHAQSRLLSRNIALTQYDMDRLESAVNKAQEKGAKESLVLMQDLAFIVSVPNRTVITVTNREQAKENVFTNIDSTIII
ncbi:MAG: flagellar protein [Candidatus Delongbacteria bacterium]|mgnify:CR=1 FL=1|nr:flagellar protein [Candidatus Delongbacteria bacterium]